MGYFSLDIKKAKGTSDTTQSDHIERKIIPKNADPTRTHLNRVLVEYPDGVHGRDEAIAHRLNTAGIRRKITHDQVRVVRVVLSGTHEDMMNIQEKGELDEWCSDSIQWLQATFGKDNVVAAHLHMDEKTPHIHAAVVPIVTGERRKAKKEQTDGKRKYRKKTNSVRLCADDLFNRQTLIAYHDNYARVMANYARVMAKYGLQRGVRGSEARHTSTTQYYRDMKKKNDALDMENKRLQEQKAKAEQELKRAKKEVQTEKLKGAATIAATNIAESVGSLFGSGKMKSLERRNEDLQDRILELEEEARQREQQQTKQIQEIKTAYEQQNSKLSEFVDFVKRYFPYVEKLMPTIKFLRNTLNFGDAVIRKLCTFKDVSIKGELYSREFNQHFRADKTICSLKEDKDGNFNLNIDGVSHVSWFRRKKDEFMQSLGMPTRKQDKGIRL